MQRGHPLYTPGAKARIGGLPERADRKKWHVVGKSAETNTVFVCLGADHPALRTKMLLAKDPSWVDGEAPVELRSETEMAMSATSLLQGSLRCEVHPSVDRK